MAGRQEHAAGTDIVRAKALRQLLSGLLSAAVGVSVEAEIDGSPCFTQMPELIGVEMRTQRTGHVGEARLTQHRIVEQAFDEDDFLEMSNLLPCIQAAPWTLLGSDAQKRRRCCGRRD